MSRKTLFSVMSCLLLIALLLAACGDKVPPVAPTATSATAAPTATPRAAPPSPPAPRTAPLSPSAPPLPSPAAAEARAADLLARMTLAEKIGQMTQVENQSIAPADVTAYFIGSVLSGGGGQPQPNTPQAWAAMVAAYQEAASKTRLGIPLIYGIDAVHGMAALKGATIFPHAIGLGAADDPDLMARIARATAEQMVAAGIRWNFAPVVAPAQDIRWGRTYESFSEDPAIASRLGVAYLRGLQEAEAGPVVLGTPKHFLGDGGTRWGSSTATSMGQRYMLDQGDVTVDEATLRRIHLAPYKAAVDAGALSIMVSFSSYRGEKMHGHRALLTDVLKGELGFQGFLVSDWQAIDQLPGDYHTDVVTAINAGLDMIMVPYDYKAFIAELTKAVDAGEVSQARIDDAVRRILTVKFKLGLFDRPAADPALLPKIADDAKRALAREAVRKTLVLLKNDAALPLRPGLPLILVAGQAADDTGIQAGGWSLSWQGSAGKEIPGTTLLAAVKEAAGQGTRVIFNALGRFAQVTEPAPVCIVAVGETPYAEGVGDRADLRLAEADRALLARVRPKCQKLVVVLFSGRPLVITEELPQIDALVAAWLPGTEAGGITDALFGAAPFTGKLPFAWPRANDQLPRDPSPLFPLGFGLEIR